MRTVVLVLDLPTSPEFFEADRRIEKLVRSALQAEENPILRGERVRIVVASSPFRGAQVDKEINPICWILPGGIGDLHLPRFQGILERVIEDFCLDKKFDAIINMDFSILSGRTLQVEHIPRDPVKDADSSPKKRSARKRSRRKKR